MKFTDGLWMVKEGYTLQIPKEIADIDYSDSGITLFAPYREQENSLSAFGCGLLSVTINAVGANMFSVKITNHKGSRAVKAALELNKTIIQPVSNETEEYYSYTASLLEMRISKNGQWGISFYYAGRYLTATEIGGMAHVTAPDGKTYIREQLSLSEGEYIYGLGEAPGSIIRNGGSFDIWNEDAGMKFGRSAKCVPFFISSRGYGVLVNSTECVSFEIANDATTDISADGPVARTQFSLEGESMEYIIIGGASMKHVLDSYSELIGRPAIPPAWSFGSWLSAPFYEVCDEDSVLDLVEQVENMGMPLSVIHFGPYWMKGFEWSSLLWDKTRFPNPHQMIKTLHDNGIRVCVWITPYISQKSPMFQEGFEGNYYINYGNGDMYQSDAVSPGAGLVDFSNLVARSWYQKFLDDLIKMGVDAFRLDNGGDAPSRSPAYGAKAAEYGITYRNEFEAGSMHNLYSYLYEEAVYDLLRRRYGENNACILGHSGFIGSHQFPFMALDNEDPSYEGMRTALSSGLSLSLSGFPFWSENIGGLSDESTPDLYMRWHQAAMFLPNGVFGGVRTFRVPWQYGTEAMNETLLFSKFKLGLMPYIFSSAVESSSIGIPMTRPMMLEFPEDQNTYNLEQQYMLGRSLLIAPITSEDGIVRYYVPSGTWTNLLTRERVEGPIWKNEQHGYDTMPILVRPGSIIVAGAFDEKPVYNYMENLTITLFELPEGKEVSADVYSADLKALGSVKALKQDGKITVRTQGIYGQTRLVLANIFRIGSTSVGIPELNEWGTMIIIDGNEIEIGVL
ncbi:MAG: alpha-xylosidase [Clostridiales bacterium]|nr:alpha-xylosidase [Clostridiales bacterium]